MSVSVRAGRDNLSVSVSSLGCPLIGCPGSWQGVNAGDFEGGGGVT